VNDAYVVISSGGQHPGLAGGRIRRRSVLGGLISEYERAA
jgi:hypothetical protein